MIATGIFGGSFNPIHNGHIGLALRLLEQCHLDEIWFVVSPQNPLKTRGSLLDDDTRLRLVRAALASHPRLKACDYEYHLPVPSYTYDTLMAMQGDFPDRRFLLLMGADNWHNFHRWYRHDDIIRRFHIIIYPREGTEINGDTLPPNAHIVETPLYNISSTMIRQRILRGESVSGLLPECVEKIITDEALYSHNADGQ